MTYPILTTRVSATTLVTLRDRTRQIGEIFGLGKIESTRFVTAVSEIARNAVQYAETGTAAFFFKDDQLGSQAIVAAITDKGPGIADIPRVMAGLPNAKGQVPMGVTGAKRLVDTLKIECPASGGTIVTIEMLLPKASPRMTVAQLSILVDELARQKPKTPLQELEKQNREMLDALQELRDKQLELQRADERKNQFLITLAHELRNPLGTLHMNLEILRRNLDIDTADLAKRRDAMARQIEQMNKLVEDLVDVSRVSQGKVSLVTVPVELNELVAQAIEMCEAAISTKGHRLTFESWSEDVWIDGDPSRLKQAFGNLIQNATRYTPKGGTLAVSLRTEHGRAVARFEDNGVGITADMLPQIFDLFVQGEGPAAHTAGGLGIGLTLVKRLIESHGGEVGASSDGPGQGSVFIVSLPLQASRTSTF